MLGIPWLVPWTIYQKRNKHEKNRPMKIAIRFFREKDRRDYLTQALRFRATLFSWNSEFEEYWMSETLLDNLIVI
jgi:hypothetical protein